MRYFVFARREYAEPVARRGFVDARNADAATGQARERYGDWLEVRLVPEDSAKWIVGPLPADRLPEDEREEVTA